MVEDKDFGCIQVTLRTLVFQKAVSIKGVEHSTHDEDWHHQAPLLEIGLYFQVEGQNEGLNIFCQ